MMMRRRLSTPLASLALAVLLLVPGAVSAAPLAVDAGFLNSRLSYLGPGAFDPAFAAAFGLLEKTGAGFVDASLLNPNGDDHTSDDRFAEDGATDVFVDAHVPVPEPSLSALLTIGAAALVGTRVRRRSRG